MSNTPWAPWKYRLGCISLTFPFYFFHLLCNSHTTKYTLWKWAILTTLVYSQGRATLTTFYSQNIFILPKRKPIPISHYSPFPPAPNLWQPPIYLLFCGFAFSRRFTEMESCNMWSFVSGFFYLASCDQGLSTLWHGSVLQTFLWPTNPVIQISHILFRGSSVAGWLRFLPPVLPPCPPPSLFSFFLPLFSIPPSFPYSCSSLSDACDSTLIVWQASLLSTW